jgi:phytoene desaturase
MHKHVIVIGAGVGGLSAAIRMAASGWVRATILEKNARVGGKLNLWEAPHPHRPDECPFRFDTGPSLLTLPFVFEDLFRSAGRSLHDYLNLIRLDPIARFTWPDGTRFELRAERADLEVELKRFSPRDIAGWHRFMQRGKRIWDLSAALFLFHAPQQLLRCAGASHGLDLLSLPFRIGMFSTYARAIEREIRSQKLREVLYQYATYGGSSPFKAPATLTVIPHAEMHFGGWYVQGGMYRLAEALEQVARDLGVEVRTGCPVEQILIDSQARGVRLADGSEMAADAVVVNSDLIYSYRRLIPGLHRPHFPDRKLNRADPGGSGMVLLLGVEGTYPQLAHHNKFMPADYRAELQAMFQTRSIPDDPSIYVCASTRTDPTQAPDGCENLFVLASAPALDERIDWSIEGPRYESMLIRMLQDRWKLDDLQRRIVVRRSISPLDLARLYNANAGSIYGLGSNSRQAAFLRPPNRDRHIPGLYFAGGATHPGGGLPLVALSGKIASELVLEDFG